MVDSSEPFNQFQTPEAKPGWRRRLPVILLSTGLVVALLVIAVLATKLTSGNGGNDGRTISVTGEAIIKDTPDQFVFYPSYAIKNADKATALSEMTKKSEAVIAGLKQVGVDDKDIKTDSNGFEAPAYPERMPAGDASFNYNLQLTVTVGNKDLAQKVQDYLLSTTPSGAVSPQPGFSDAKRKTLEAKARDEATKDARSKADQSAKNLGFTVDDVKSVDDGTGFGVQPYDAKAMSGSAMSFDASTSSMAIQPGQNDFQYSVTVVYTIR